MSSSRPDRLVLVVGTATEVGKTWVACSVAARLRSTGERVAARKAVQSYDAADATTDAQLLASATADTALEVCPPDLTYELAMAPPMAAEALGRIPPTLDRLVSHLSWPAGTRVGIVEAAGGVRSPLGEDCDSVDLAGRLRPDLVVLVAEPHLGAVNAVRASHRDLSEWDVVVFFNRFDPSDDLHRRNRSWLTERDGFCVEVDLDALVALALGDGARAGS